MQNTNASNGIIKFLKIIFSLLYFLVLIYIFFFARRRRYTVYHEVNLVPFKDIFPGSKSLHDFGSVNYDSNLIGNILIFIPFSFILIEGFKIEKLSTILIIALTTSFLVEFLQYIFNVGVADINDMILNTTGACLGYFFYLFYDRYINKN
jgi:glycopeptide antibiotics resistance protein